MRAVIVASSAAGTRCVLPPGVYFAAYEYDSSFGMISTTGSAVSPSTATVNSRPQTYRSTSIRSPCDATSRTAGSQSADSLMICTPTEEPLATGLTTHGQPISAGIVGIPPPADETIAAFGVGMPSACMIALVI